MKIPCIVYFYQAVEKELHYVARPSPVDVDVEYHHEVRAGASFQHGVPLVQALDVFDQGAYASHF